MIEIILITMIIFFIIIYRKNNGENVYKYLNDNVGKNINKYAPYSFSVVREKTKQLGQEYTVRQYISQILIFSVVAGIISTLYFYNIVYIVCDKDGWFYLLTFLFVICKSIKHT